MVTHPQGQMRLAELIAAISLATDLGTGQPTGHALRTCYLAMGLARELGVSVQDEFDTFYLALLRFLGCTAEASDDATINGGDDIALYAGVAPFFMGAPTEILGWMMRHLAEGERPLARVRAVTTALADPKGQQRSIRAHCEVGRMLSRRIGLGRGVQAALGSAFERWDGKGLPDGVDGEAIPVASRIAIVARDYDLLNRVCGPEEAERILKERRGKAYDPKVLDGVLRHGTQLMREMEGGSLLEKVLAAEPGPEATIDPAHVDDVLGVFAHFTDLKSPFLRGHSTGVAELAEKAGRVAGNTEPGLLRRAGLVHDLGRVAIPSGIWNKAGALVDDEWERVRLHPYYSERILVRCGPLEHLAEIASSHHERMDGSGYHRGSRAQALSTPARLLATADVFHALTETRPYRGAMTLRQAADELEEACVEGRLDITCVRAVLEAAGESSHPSRSRWPAELTDREVEVLRLLARGLSNKQVARELTLSPKTVGRHIEHIYAKAGVSTRAGATLFAMEEGLLTQ